MEASECCISPKSALIRLGCIKYISHLRNMFFDLILAGGLVTNNASEALVQVPKQIRSRRFMANSLTLVPEILAQMQK